MAEIAGIPLAWKLAEDLIDAIDGWARAEQPSVLSVYYEENRVPFAAARWVASEIVRLKNTRAVALEQTEAVLRGTLEATNRLREACEAQAPRDVYPGARLKFEVAVGRLVVHGGIWAGMRGFLAFDHGAPIATVQAAKEAQAECADHAKQTKAVLDRARREAKDLFTKEGANLFAEEFESYAKEQRRASTYWLCGAGALFVFTLAAAFHLLLPESLDWLQWMTAEVNEPNAAGGPTFDLSGVGELTGRIAIVSLSTYATTWCARMSQVLRHAATVNEHRANSAKAILAFRKGASDDETKNQILVEATKAVFQNIQTGYLGKVEGPPGAALLGSAAPK